MSERFDGFDPSLNVAAPVTANQSERSSEPWKTRAPREFRPLPSVVPRVGNVFADVVQSVKPGVVVEFGSWEGASVLRWCLELRKMGISAHVYCVDTWLGSIEHWRNTSRTGEWSFEHLRLESGEPQVFETFCHAIHEFGFQSNVSPLRASTYHGTHYLSLRGVKADLVYVDAGHSFLDVYRDLNLACSLLRDDAVIVGDDWLWRGVRSAVIVFSLRSEFIVFTSPDSLSYVLVPKRNSDLVHELRKRGYKRESITRQMHPQSLRKFVIRRT